MLKATEVEITVKFEDGTTRVYLVQDDTALLEYFTKLSEEQSLD